MTYNYKGSFEHNVSVDGDLDKSAADYFQDYAVLLERLRVPNEL